MQIDIHPTRSTSSWVSMSRLYKDELCFLKLTFPQISLLEGTDEHHSAVLSCNELGLCDEKERLQCASADCKEEQNSHLAYFQVLDS